MSGPVSFNPFLGWVDITDPNNVPPDARIISAGDLLRYENLGKDAVAKINEHDAAINGGLGTSRVITGPTLPSLPPGTEYVWNKTDGAGTLLDILSGVA